MKSVWICTAPLVVVVLTVALVGCGGTARSAAVSPAPTPSTTPVTPAPQVGSAQPPMAAFIEGPVAFSTNSRLMYTATNDGSGVTQITTHPRDLHSVYVLPDGSKAVFIAHDANGYSQVYYLSPVSSTVEPVQLTTTSLDKTSAMLSADGSKITFSQFGRWQGDYPSWDAAVMDANGNNLHVIPPPDGSFSHPFFSPDAKTIVVGMGVAAFGADWHIYTMNADGTHLTKLTPDHLPGEKPAFSPDGTQIVFNSTAWGDEGLYMMNTEGTGLKRVGLQDSSWRDPLFVGDRIMFVRGADIYSMKSDGTDVKQVTDNTLEDAFER